MDKTAKTKGNAQHNSNAKNKNTATNVFYEPPQDPWNMTQTPIFADFDLQNGFVRGSMLHIDFLSFGKLTKMMKEMPNDKMLFIRQKEFLMPQGFFVVDYHDHNCIEHIVQCAKQMGNVERVYIFDDASEDFIKNLRDALKPTTQLGILSINITNNPINTGRNK